MAFIAVVGAILGPSVAGFLVVRLLAGRSAPPLLLAALGCGLGMGASSQLMFVWLILFGPAGRGYVLTEVSIMAAISALALGALRLRLGEQARRKDESGISPVKCAEGQAAGVSPRVRRFCVALALVFALIGVSRFAIASCNRPYGAWDAVAFWNLKARFLFQGTPDWRLVFSPRLGGSHQDYPLMVPLTVARVWTYLGRETAVAAPAVALLFAMLCVMLVSAAVAATRGNLAGWVALAALVTCPSFFISAASQGADVEVAFYLLATAVCWLWPLQQTDRPWLMIVVGAMVGIGAWVKFEGQSFLVFFLIAAALDCLLAWRSDKRLPGREMALFLAGLAIPVGLVVFFEHSLAPRTDNFNRDPALVRSYVLSPARYWTALRALAGALSTAIPGVVLLLVYLGMAGASRPRSRLLSRRYLLMALVLGSQAVLLFFAYVTTVESIEWLVLTSALRLFQQLWPAIVLLWALVAQLPGNRQPQPC